MRGVPGGVAAAGAVVMSNDRASGGVARPVVTGRVCRAADHDTTVRVGAGENVVLVGCVAAAIDRRALFVERKFLVDAVPIAIQVAVQVGDIPCDDCSTRVVPRSASDTIARVDGLGLSLSRRGAQVGAPGPVTGSDGRRELLAVGICSGETAQIGSVTLSD